MKKVVIMFFVISIIFGFALDASAYAQESKPTADKTPEYKVGDKMPDYTQGTFFRDQQFFATEGAEPNNCLIFIQRYLRNGLPKYLAVFTGFELGISPFAILDADPQTLFIDNKDTNGKNEPDGLIDEIIKNPIGRDPIKDHPYCNKK